MNFTGVASTRIHEVWAEVEPLIEQAVSRSGEMSPTDVLVSLLKADMQLWLVEDGGLRAVAITEIVDHPCCRVCTIPYVAGVGRRDWQHFILTIEEWAKAQGCSRIAPEPRFGWEKDLASLGYRKSRVIMEKRLG